MTEVKTSCPQTVANIEKQLRIVTGVIKQKGRAILIEYDLTPPQFVALQWLSDNGDLTIGELSARMYLAFSTTTDLIDRLENNDLVKRVKDKNDRRVVRVHLLPKANMIIESVIEKRQDYLDNLLTILSEDELNAFNSTLNHIHDQISNDF